MAEEELIITFDDSSKEEVFEMLGLIKQKDGTLVDSKEGILTDQDYEEIKSNNFGGVLIGSKVFISKDASDLATYFSSEII